MSTVVLVIHLFIAVSLVAVVLLQRSEGGALGMGGGGQGGGFGGILSGRGAGNALTRATALLAAAFFVTSITLALLATSSRNPGSFFDQPASTTAPAPAPAPVDTTPQAPASSANPQTPPASESTPPATPPAGESTPAAPGSAPAQPAPATNP